MWERFLAWHHHLHAKGLQQLVLSEPIHARRRSPAFAEDLPHGNNRGKAKVFIDGILYTTVDLNPALERGWP